MTAIKSIPAKPRSRRGPRELYAPARPVRFLKEEDEKLQQAALRLGIPLAQLIRLCVRVVDPGNLPPDTCNLTMQLASSLRDRLGGRAA